MDREPAVQKKNMAIKMSILRSFIFAIYLFQNVCSVVGQAFVTENLKPEPAALQYCSFFNNRAPQAQPGLKNCTWFKGNSCCQQQEIEATFGVVKPLKGASVQCQRFINYLMCYICAPNQNTFYQKERLTVCESFCHSFYEACLGASLKGNRIVELYPNGREFCISRRFLVGSSNCFSFDVTLDTKASSGRSANDPSLALLLPTLLFFYYLMTTLTKSTFWENLRNRVTIIAGEMNTEHTITIACSSAMCKQFGAEKWILLLFVASIGMVGGAVADGGDSMEVIRGEDVRQWASALSRDLEALSEDGLAFSAVQKLYREMPYKPVRVSRVDELKKLKESLENYLSAKKQLAEDTSSRAAEIYDGLALEEGEVWISGDDLDYKSVDDLPRSVYLDANRLYSYQLNESREYSSLLRQKVIWGQSVVKLPDSVGRKKKDVIQTVDWTSRIDEIFKENKRNYPELRWQYFGSNTGVFRLYPGVEWRRDFVGFPEDFEPRMQPWYVDLKSGARNIVIIIDASAAMAKKKGMSRAKIVASVLIDSLNQNHNVAVIGSSSDAWDDDGNNKSGTVNVLGCRQNGLDPATSHHKEDLVLAVQRLEEGGGSDHIPAFRKAFDLLRMRQNEDPAGKDCGSLVVFITGGKAYDDDLRCTPGFYKYSEDNRKSFHAGDHCKYDNDMLLKVISVLQDSLPGGQAKIFTFVTSVQTKDDLKLPGNMACENNGVMSKILADDEEASFFDQMKAYFQFVETTKTIADPLLTDVYVSPIDDATTFTVSSAVVSNVTKKRIGVVGIDVALSEIEDLLRSTLSGDGEVFLVDLADGTAIVHPLAKHSYDIEDFLPHVFFSELETESGIPEDFATVLHEMMSGKTGNYTITNNAKVAFLHKGNLLWRRVKSVQYFYTHIADTQFGIGVKYYSLREEEMVPDLDAASGESYYHLILSSKSDQLKDVREQLDIATSSSKYYQGVNISTQHSVVAFGPEAFCNTSVYHDQSGSSSVSQIQDALNSGISDSQPCVIKAMARRDAVVTLAMESVWLSRDPASVTSVASTYVATPSGMMRVYPGVIIPKTELLVFNEEPWYTRAVVNKGGLSFSAARRGHHVTDVVITISRAILNGSNCDASLTFCDYLKVHGVAGIDVGNKEFQVVVHSTLTNASEQTERSCGKYSQRYPCYANRNQMCQTQCFLINNIGEVFYGLPRRRNVILSDLHSYVFKVLQHNRIFVPKKSVGYQATCLDTGEIPEQTNPGDFKPLFEMRHSCVEETLFYVVDRERLANNFSGVFSRSLDDDPCHSGIFFLTPVANTDLLLLVFDDFQDLSENVSNRACQKFKRESQPMTKQVERRPCSDNVTLGATPFIDPCNRARAFIMPCGYSTAALAAFHSFVFLFLCFLLTLVFLI